MNQKEKRNLKFKNMTYGRGAMRAMSVGLRAVKDLKLSDNDALALLREFRDQLYEMYESKDFDPPYLDRAIYLAAQKLGHELPEPVAPQDESAQKS